MLAMPVLLLVMMTPRALSIEELSIEPVESAALALPAPSVV